MMSFKMHLFSVSDDLVPSASNAAFAGAAQVHAAGAAKLGGIFA
jgi:hypothetical protein